MIMMDGVHPDMDTCILIDYKGILILFYGGGGRGKVIFGLDEDMQIWTFLNGSNLLQLRIKWEP